MSEIKVNNGNIEDALKRFKRQCARNGVLQEVRKREHYEKPSVRRKKKSEAARKRKYNSYKGEITPEVDNITPLYNFFIKKYRTGLSDV